MDYKPTDNSAMGTSLRGYVETSYLKLVELFGKPNGGESFDGKCSTQWNLIGDDDEIITIYDYKETELYSEGLLTVEEFRKLPKYEWHIGAKSDVIAGEFLNFCVSNKIGKVQRGW